MAIIKPNNNTLSAVTALPFGTGKILQVKSQFSASTVAISGTSNVFADICGGSMSFTPAASSSNILCMIVGGMDTVTGSVNTGYTVALSLSQTSGLSVSNDKQTLYGYYPLSATMGTSSNYGQNVTMIKSYGNSSANAITITGLGNAYSEGESMTARFKSSTLTVMEWI
tara:strand:- start:269 stop:775 length:507 start_codon:yes stop_codon:yes gene_type:complete